MTEIDLATVTLSYHCSFPKITNEHGVYYNGIAFLNDLCKWDSIDVMTYTFNPNIASRYVINRLVFTVGFGKKPINVKAQKQAHNIHTKIYICYEQAKVKEIYCGSMNLVAPTFLEVITVMPKKSHKSTMKYFDHIWSQIP